jgi:hypothetical protein
MRAQPRIAEAFRTGGGMAWGEHDPGVFEGTERFFRPGYVANLVDAWIPALDGAEAKLRAGASVADAGCGHGASTIVMARAFRSARASSGSTTTRRRLLVLARRRPPPAWPIGSCSKWPARPISRATATT